jgi:hypothetical protein
VPAGIAGVLYEETIMSEVHATRGRRNGNSPEPVPPTPGDVEPSLADQIGIATKDQLIPGVYGHFAVFDADTAIVVRPSTRNNQNNIFPEGKTRDSLATTIGRMFKSVPEYLTRYHGHVMNNQADSKMKAATKDGKSRVVALDEWRTQKLKDVEEGKLGTTRTPTTEPVEEREMLARLAAYDILKPLCVASGMTMPDKPRAATWEVQVNGKPLLDHAKALLESPMGPSLYKKADDIITARMAAVAAPEGVDLAAMLGFAPAKNESDETDDDEEIDEDDTDEETPETSPTP